MSFYNNILTPILRSIEQFPSRNAFCIDEEHYSYHQLGQCISKIRCKLAKTDYHNTKVGLVINDDVEDKLFIQTRGAHGLTYRLNSGWMHLEPMVNDNVVDTASAGDWTAAALINELYKDKEKQKIFHFTPVAIAEALNAAQRIRVQSCSYEGARGMMQ